MFYLLVTWPGIALGLVYGAIGWRRHWVAGAALGASIGAIVCGGILLVWTDSALSASRDFLEVRWQALGCFVAGSAGGAAAGAALRHRRRNIAVKAGTLAGGILGLAGWALFSLV